MPKKTKRTQKGKPQRKSKVVIKKKAPKKRKQHEARSSLKWKSKKASIDDIKNSTLHEILCGIMYNPNFIYKLSVDTRDLISRMEQLQRGICKKRLTKLDKKYFFKDKKIVTFINKVWEYLYCGGSYPDTPLTLLS